MRDIAREVARKLNRLKGLVIFLIPLKGWSSLDKERMTLYDPETDKIFIDEIKRHLSHKVVVKGIDLHLNTREFAEEAIHQFLTLHKLEKSC